MKAILESYTRFISKFTSKTAIGDEDEIWGLSFSFEAEDGVMFEIWAVFFSCGLCT